MTITMDQLIKTPTIVYIFNKIELVKKTACRAQMNTDSTYRMLLVTEGCGSIALGSGRADLQRDTCLLLEPGMTCLLEVGKEGLIFYLISFEVVCSQKQAKTGAEQLIFHKLLSQSVMNFSSCMLLVEKLYRYRQEQDELELLENQLRFQTLLLTILRQNRMMVSEDGMRQAVQHSIEYVQENYDQPLSIDQLAAIAATNRWQYTKVFKEMTGHTPIGLLNTVRIDKAQQLLLLTGDRLNEIARAVGYSNEYYFNRKFKQMIGLTPGQYRSYNQTTARVFAPFMEDYLLALGITPVLQYSHKLWGRQDYLELREVPDFDITSDDWTTLSRYKTEFIILNSAYQRWGLEKCSDISPVFKLPYTGEDWQTTLLAMGTIFGRKDKALQAIEEHESKAAAARARLANTIQDETVAVLRISSQAVTLYGGSTKGYTGPLLYSNLGLAQPALVQQLTSHKRRIDLTLEELARLDADHLFITFDKAEGEDAGRELTESQVWNNLPAVKGNRVYEVDFMAWMNYGVLSHNRKIDDVLQILG
jgi:ABC-type Fe3+-hydroxamate transport system substrate-binding protein/AraC-like DNA-binding protein